MESRVFHCSNNKPDFLVLNDRVLDSLCSRHNLYHFLLSLSLFFSLTLSSLEEKTYEEKSFWARSFVGGEDWLTVYKSHIMIFSTRLIFSMDAT